MPAISFDRFDGGLDVRQLAGSADANRLRVLENAYVSTGRTIRKRPGLRRVQDLPAGCVGLFAGLDALWTFAPAKLGLPEKVGMVNIVSLPDADALADLEHAEVFNGYVYAVLRLADGSVRHAYADGGGWVADAPRSAAVIKKAGKLFAVDGDVVRFSATGKAADWTADKDAGFLPVALQQSVNGRPVALGEYQDNLVVFFEDSAQVWHIDPDPMLHRLVTTFPVGTRYAHAHANMGADIFFLSPSGFRSVAVQAFTANMTDNDIGSPIDDLVRSDMAAGVRPRMVYFRGAGQLLCVMGDWAYVYVYSRSSKVSAWSVWRFPFRVAAAAELAARLYLCGGGGVYVLDTAAFDDDGAGIAVRVELPFLDMRRPGVLKQFTGADVAASGSLKLRFKFDPRRPDAATGFLALRDDTRPLPRIPVEVAATNLALDIRHEAAEAFELAALTLYFEDLSGFAT